MTIKELKELIKDLPDDLLVGYTGYFGEYLEFYSAEVDTVYEGSGIDKNGKITILQFEIEDKGSDPDNLT